MCGVFNLRSLQLFLDSKRMKKISSKNKRVQWCEDRMNPASGNEEGISSS